ncbi:hypothetical protein [Lutispora thermophila]|uniref:Uncharacterized protein n=1 Tax=Lutispora thermophila DSM 19022 TaxID=1122184 RepID=A0A1M6IH11_9FIRM|nr:hypothetical protein [Lutispora thermophila]SHJ33646.1 hypothetical protein SAMN02745176_03250 [Lutispora thermophila DSM 19022]
MIDKYVLAIICAITGYIVFFDSFFKKEKWSVSKKRKFKKIYISIWIILYFVYLVCIWANPSTRPFFKEHVAFGAFFHSIFAFLTWIITIYY